MEVHPVNILTPTTTSLLTTYWKDITKHQRDPKHLTLPLPWKFKDVYDDLISSGVQLLRSPTEITTTTPMPFAARDVIQASSTNTTNISTIPLSSNRSTSIGIHHTRDGRKFLSHNNALTSARRLTCFLCTNKHVNPWHPTENCPYKHPTQILPKDVHERIMQHNALLGAEKQDYTKDQDLPTTRSTPPQAASAITATEETITESSQSPSTPPLIHSSLDAPLLDDDEIIETDYFDILLPPPSAIVASIMPSDHFADLDPGTVITDPLQYLSYES